MPSPHAPLMWLNRGASSAMQALRRNPAEVLLGLLTALFLSIEAFGGGLAFGAAALTKPALLFWPAAMVPVWWLAARGMGRPALWGRLAACGLITAAAMAGVSTRAMMPSPCQSLSQRGGRFPRPCSVR